MDFLRSCYSTTFRANADQPEHLFTTRWYFAPAGAHLFPVPHRFGSTNYSRQVPAESPFGELVNAVRTWDPGATPAGLHGTNFCGSLDYWQGGTPVLTTPIPSRADGEPACCDGPAGIAVPCCPGFGLPSVLRGAFSNPTGTCGCLNGQVVPFVWDGLEWAASPMLCGQPCVMALVCTGTPPRWRLASSGCQIFSNLFQADRCQPFHLRLTGVVVVNCCFGTIDVTVTP